MYGVSLQFLFGPPSPVFYEEPNGDKVIDFGVLLPRGVSAVLGYVAGVSARGNRVAHAEMARQKILRDIGWNTERIGDLREECGLLLNPNYSDKSLSSPPSICSNGSMKTCVKG